MGTPWRTAGSSSISRTAFRAVRGLVVRPVTTWYRRQDALEQLEGLAALGDGVAVMGSLSIGHPTGTSIGDDVSIGAGFVSIGGGHLVVGSHVHMGRNVRIVTSNHRYREAELLPYDHVRLDEGVDIGDAVWLGDSVMVTPGARIGEGAIVAMGAVVAGEVPPMSVVAGVPARVVGHRDEQHYRALRDAGRYLNWPREHRILRRPAIVRRR